MATDHPKSWYKYLGYIMWALREVPNETTGVAPWMLAFGRLPRGPLAVLKETWCGERDFPLDLGKSPVDFLKELHEKLEIAELYAKLHTTGAQHRYATRYNLRSRDKHFNVNDQVLILQPDSTASHLHSKWKGPATIVEVRSPYSYIVELNGARYRLHANLLRPFYVKTVEVDVNQFASVSTCAIIYDNDEEFGDIEALDTVPSTTNCAVDDNTLPSQRIDPAKLAHLSESQRSQLLQILDNYADVFSDVPGLCDLVEHEIPLATDFKPKRLHAYRVPERLKPQVDQQIQELLKLGFIKPSKSPMASPLVCVLKGKDGKDGVRLAIDYRYLNRYTVADAFPFPDINETIQKIGNAHYISLFDTTSGFWQTRIKESDQWKTAFICAAGLFWWTRTAFGMRSSGNTFVRAVQAIIQPIKSFTGSFVDDLAVFSEQWLIHLQQIEQFLQTIRAAGLTLKLKKSRFAMSEVKFCGELVGSGKRRADPEKVAAIYSLKVPETKTQVRQILGFFSYFRDHLPNYAAIAKPLTELTGKSVPNTVPWGPVEQQALDRLKSELSEATTRCLHIINPSLPFLLEVDASDHTVAGVLRQSGSGGPIAFTSLKLNKTQRGWATVEKEAYAALSALRKFRNWVWGSKVTVLSDHNPLTYLTESAPKSAKLMRWALALQEFDINFCYRSGKLNTAADTLSRLGPDEPIPQPE